jgi:polyisoprenoid-binding protein YceI
MRTAIRVAAAGLIALAPTVLAASTAMAAPVTPAAVTCGAYAARDTSGAHAMVRECYDGSLVRVNGTVTDTDADGQCARVYATYDVYQGTDYSPTACPKGKTVTFTLPWRAGTDAFIYLQEI